MRPATIKYRDGKQIVTIKADGCMGEVPAGSSTYYCIFYLKGVQVARVAESHLLPSYDKQYQKLFGRPWLEKITNADSIHLTVYRDWEDRLDGYPHDTEQIWMVNSDSHTWVIQRTNGATLHIMNNDEVTRRGAFKDAVKKLFPGKKIKVYHPTVTVVEL